MYKRYVFLTIMFFGIGIIGCQSSDEALVEKDKPKEAAPAAAKPASANKLTEITTHTPKQRKEMSKQEESLLKEGIPGFRSIYVAGEYQTVIRDPESGKLAWRGMTCTHPDCTGKGHDGGPHIFPDIHPGLDIDANGQMTGRPNAGALRCPACNRLDKVELYSPPSTIDRRNELKLNWPRFVASGTKPAGRALLCPP